MLKFLAIFFLVIYLIGFLAKYAFRRWINSLLKQQSGGYQTDSHKEGDVTINFTPDDKKKFNESEGEYVDYEEVK